MKLKIIFYHCFIILLFVPCVCFAQLDSTSIMIPDTTVSIGQTFSINILTSELISDWNVTAYQFEVNIDTNFIDYIGYDVTSTLSSGGMVSINDNEDFLSVGFINSTAIEGSGCLIRLEFRTMAAGNTSINISDFLFNSTNILNLKSGLIEIQNDYSGVEISVTNAQVSEGDHFNIEVSTGPLEPEWNITAYQFNMTIDTNIIDYQGVIVDSTLSDGGMITVNNNGNNLSVGYINSTALEGTGNLINFEFKAVNNGSIYIDISNFLYNTTGIFNINSGFVEVGSVNIDRINFYSDNFILSQNYPNPFNPFTTIDYQLPKKSSVKILIYDMNGKQMDVLVNQNEDAGYYSVEWNASQYPSGLYFYKIVADGFVDVKKMVLLK